MWGLAYCVNTQIFIFHLKSYRWKQKYFKFWKLSDFFFSISQICSSWFQIVALRLLLYYRLSLNYLQGGTAHSITALFPFSSSSFYSAWKLISWAELLPAPSFYLLGRLCWFKAYFLWESADCYLASSSAPGQAFWINSFLLRIKQSSPSWAFSLGSSSSPQCLTPAPSTALMQKELTKRQVMLLLPRQPMPATY